MKKFLILCCTFALLAGCQKSVDENIDKELPVNQDVNITEKEEKSLAEMREELGNVFETVDEKNQLTNHYYFYGEENYLLVKEDFKNHVSELFDCDTDEMKMIEKAENIDVVKVIEGKAYYLVNDEVDSLKKFENHQSETIYTTENKAFEDIQATWNEYGIHFEIEEGTFVYVFDSQQDYVLDRDYRVDNINLNGILVEKEEQLYFYEYATKTFTEFSGK